MKRSLLSILLLFVVIGCSSYADKAQEHMELGNFEKAHEFWVKALTDDPDDSEVLRGKQLCENEITNKKLVELRNLIRSGQVENSLALAYEIETLHKEWDYSSSHDLSRFHEKQLRSLYPLYRKLFTSQSYNNYPLKQKFLLDHYEGMFVKRNLRQLEDIENNIFKSGVKKCLTYQTKRKNKWPFYRDFVSKYCRLFMGDKEQAEESKINTILYGDIRLKQNVIGLGHDYDNEIQEALYAKLQSSPYYDSKSKNILNITFSGSLKNTQNTQTKVFYHNYTVQVPYNVKERVKEEVSVPYEVTEEKCNADGCIKKTFTKYKKQKKYVDKVVTKYKDVPKSLPYRGRLTTRNILTKFNASFNLLDQKKLNSSFFDDSHEEAVNHNVNNPLVGLVPKREKLQSMNDFIRSLSKKFASNLFVYINGQWDHLYCDANLKPQIARTFENVLRCLRYKKSRNGASKKALWLKNYFNLEESYEKKAFEEKILR